MNAFDLSRAALRTTLVLFISVIGVNAAELGKTKPDQPKVVAASDEGELAIKKFKVPDGFKIELFAAEPRLANPVCFTIDEKGRFYVAETFRHTDGTLDVRKHMDWLDEELANRTVEEHLEKIKRHQDEVPNMTRETERVRLIEDRNGDGKADFDSVFAENFNSELHGIGAGLLARKGDVYYTCIPNLYLLRDEDGDGKADVQKILQTGYGVRFAFIGHDLHGLKMGPDGRLYFSIGDRGFSVKQGDRTIAFPEGGAVLRCNLDGSDLEIFSYGLRNPQELAFDQYGNLWTGENNSDGGDEVRWVYLVEGSDSGWRIGYQYISHPNSRGPWNSEKMWHTQTAGQPAYIVPPIANFGNGPAGLSFYPGVGLPEEYANHFFLCDFRGNSASSLIHTFSVKPKGASFEVINRREFAKHILCTDVEFGPDGGIYISDWTEGWDKPGKGRIYRVVNTNTISQPLVAETKSLINAGFENRSISELATLLSHSDMRVRQEAQFELADRGQKSVEPLIQVAKKNENQLARIHAIWGLGQIARKANETPKLKQAALQPLVDLLSDGDPEIKAQAAKVFADARFAPAANALASMVQNVKEPRGQFFAAMALGKIGDKSLVRPILEMLRGANDEDAFLRHAGVMALLWMGDYEVIRQAANDESPAVQMGALLAMRRLQHADVAGFLDNKQQKLVVEAARAINDLPIIQGLPALAALIERSHFDEPLVRRVLNANFRLGNPENAHALVKFADRTDAPANLRAEALELLINWTKPSGRDYVTGLWRPLTERDPSVMIEAVRPKLAHWLQDAPAEVKWPAVRLVNAFRIDKLGPVLSDLAGNSANEIKARIEALKALVDQNEPEAAKAIEIALKDESEKMRKEAVSMQAKLNPGDATAPLLIALQNGSVGEQQSALSSLGTVPDKAAEKILADWMDRLVAGTVPVELHLDLIEAAAKRSSENLNSKLAQFEAARGEDMISKYRETMSGGNAEEGRKIFFERVEASCVRCHKIKGEGGEAGPILDGIGSRATREYLLASIVDPNREIAPGFESVILFLKDGTSYAGTLQKEDKNNIVINSPEDGPVTLKTKDVAKRERGVSGMPAELAQVLSKQDIRNIVEYLASLK